MKKKSILFATIGTLGGLCALCCIVPIAGFFGLGALEAFFCDSYWARGLGIGLMAISFGYFIFKVWWRGFCSEKVAAARCSTGCGCNSKVLGDFENFGLMK